MGPNINFAVYISFRNDIEYAVLYEECKKKKK